MPRNHPGLILKIAATLLFLGVPIAAARGGPDSYSIDILSHERYPQIQDSYMMRINNNGVGAGYIATQSILGPYLPTTYAGGGQLHSLGNQSIGFGQYFGIVTGINDRGDVVGNVTNADNSRSMYVERGGTVQTITLPAGGSGGVVTGIGANGLAYGGYTDANGFYQVFTATGSVANPLPLSLPGLPNVSTDSGLLSRTGMLGLYAVSSDYSAGSTLLYNLNTSATTELAVPTGFAYDNMYRVSTTGVYGSVDNADFSVERLASWNLDGSFRGFIDVPPSLDQFSVHFNDLGQAIGLATGGQLMYFDGASWSPRSVNGLGGYHLAEIDDFSNRGDFVGLAANSQGFEYGFVATAVPEPASVILTGTGLLAVCAQAARRRRRRTSRGAPGSRD